MAARLVPGLIAFADPLVDPAFVDEPADVAHVPGEEKFGGSVEIVLGEREIASVLVPGLLLDLGVEHDDEVPDAGLVLQGDAHAARPVGRTALDHAFPVGPVLARNAQEGQGHPFAFEAFEALLQGNFVVGGVAFWPRGAGGSGSPGLAHVHELAGALLGIVLHEAAEVVLIETALAFVRGFLAEGAHFPLHAVRVQPEIEELRAAAGDKVDYLFVFREFHLFSRPSFPRARVMGLFAVVRLEGDIIGLQEGGDGR